MDTKTAALAAPLVEATLRKAKTLHAGVELDAAQAEQPGSPGLVAAGLFERALDELALDGLEIHTLRRELSACGGSGGRGSGQGEGDQRGAVRSVHAPRQVLGIDQAPPTENQGPLPPVAQLAHVPRPGVGQEIR